MLQIIWTSSQGLQEKFCKVEQDCFGALGIDLVYKLVNTQTIMNNQTSDSGSCEPLVLFSLEAKD
jgi:hypothetical protein